MVFRAECISTARKRAGMTQKQLAEAMGISPMYLSQLECGRATPSLALLDSLAEATDTRIVLDLVT